ncbi:hypothetical protein BGW80DRAFT_541265 [Lactifluus volemus]|nr:hypothetical protein BGW80DRAFT_541265 [Lactifluus volemus]
MPTCACPETSVNSLSRILSTSSLPAARIDKVYPLLCPPLPIIVFHLILPTGYQFQIVNLVSTRPRVSKLDFFYRSALAQAGKDVSVEQVALLVQQNTLPELTLDISLLSYSAAATTTSNATTTTASRLRLSCGQPCLRLNQGGLQGRQAYSVFLEHACPFTD